MKIRKTNARILLFLVPSLCAALVPGEAVADGAAVDPLDVRQGVHEDAQLPGVASISGGATRPETKGTKDAPVDGQDGKPHDGPFIDTWADKNPGERYDTNAQKKQLAEDGVMNDPNRTPPKKGTTGTEGGVTEKERDRKAEESQTGQTRQNTPDSPKEAPKMPQSETPGKGFTKEGMASEKSGTGVTGSPGAKHDDYPVLKPDKQGDKDDFPKFDPTTPKTFDKQRPPAKQGFDEEEVDRYFEHDDDDGDEDFFYSTDDDGIHDIIPWDSLAGSFSSIAATEIGDKTFIVAALMAMRHPRLQVFTAAFSALLVMTVLSGVTGHAVGALLSKRWSAMLAALLFLVFGVKSLREGFAMSPDQGVTEEIREVQAELEEMEVDMARHANGHRRTSSISPYALEAGRKGSSPRSRSSLKSSNRSPSSSPSRSPSPKAKPLVSSVTSGIKNLLSLVLSPAWVETFSMTFVGELGDRSQIATVAMAAGQEYFWIMVGASLGHFVCTGVAVLGGSVLAGRVSMRKVTLTGGAIFIGFGLFTLLEAIQYFQ